MENLIYSTKKILYHPDALCCFKRGLQQNPIQIHLMPDNRCNHNCRFCSYRITTNKNNQLFDGMSYIPEHIMKRLITDLKEMNVKAIELTGGGEPLIYPFKDTMFDMIIDNDFDYSLVSNGTLLTEELAKKIAPKITWARISVDASNKKTYSIVRNVNEQGFDKAINAIKYLKKFSQNPEFKLGMGFVVNNDNYNEVYEACKLAKESGADNVRISAIFHPDGLNYFTKNAINIGKNEAQKAESLSDNTFHVYNLFNERIDNITNGKQDYKFCGTKEILCVIGGDCNVYTCCSLAFNKKGLIGNISELGFHNLWHSKHKIEMFNTFNASKICTFECLYENRNKFINEIISEKHDHINFI